MKKEVEEGRRKKDEGRRGKDKEEDGEEIFWQEEEASALKMAARVAGIKTVMHYPAQDATEETHIMRPADLKVKVGQFGPGKRPPMIRNVWAKKSEQREE